MLTPEQRATVEHAFTAVRGTIDNLAARWDDEKEYEDFKEYTEVIAGALPEGVRALSYSQKPFGVMVQIAGVPQRVQFYVTAKEIGWRTR